MLQKMYSSKGPLKAIPYQELGKETLGVHFALRKALWQTCTNPLALLTGGP